MKETCFKDWCSCYRCELQDDRNDSYITALKQYVTEKTQLALTILPTNRKDRYDAIKKFCCVDHPGKKNHYPVLVPYARRAMEKFGHDWQKFTNCQSNWLVIFADCLKININDLYKDQQCSSVICIIHSEKISCLFLTETMWKRKYKLVNVIVGNNEMIDIYQYIQKVFEIIA